MRSFAVLLFLSAVLWTPSSAAPPVPSSALDVHYDAEERTLGGIAELRVVPQGPTIYLTLLANLDREANPHLSARALDARYPFGFEPAETIVFGVEEVNGGTARQLAFRTLALPAAWQTYSLADTVLAIDLPQAASDATEPLTLRIEFETRVPRNDLGDDGITAEILTWRFGWFPTLLPAQEEIAEKDGRIAYANREAFPLVFPWMHLEATITAPVSSPLLCGADTVAVLSDETEEEETGERRSRIAFDTPARSIALTIGGDYARYALAGTIPIEVAYLPGHEAAARFLATLARDIAEEYEGRYGTYPRARLTIVENPNLNGLSFAADGIVWLSRRFFTHRNILFSGALHRVLEYVLAHEIAHQWVGLGTGIDLNAEAWLSEGLAQYLSIRYFEGKYGAFGPNLFGLESAGLVEELVKRQLGFFNLREHLIELPYLMTQYIGFDEALVKPIENVRFSNVSDVRLYDKGYLVARAIASAIGEEAFDQAIRQAIDERRADLLDVRTFQALLEAEAGRSLDEVFATWVLGEGRVDYEVRITSRERIEGEHVTRVAVRRVGGAAQPVDVEVTLQSGATTRQEWDGEDEAAELLFRTPSRVVRATIDPDHRLPDLDRLSNNDPVKIVGGTNEAAYPLDAYVLTADSRTGGVVFSYLDRLRVSIAQGSASAEVKLDRTHRLLAQAALAGDRFAAGIALEVTEYAQPETGSPATFWEPDVSWTFSLRRLYDEAKPFVAFGLQVVDPPSFASSRTTSLSIDVTASGSGRLTIAATDELRVLARVYLQGSTQIGVSFGSPPAPFRFRLAALHAFLRSGTTHEIVAGLKFEVPILGELPYNLFNLVMIDRIRSRLYVAGGLGWTTPDEFGTTSPCIEAGIEQVFDLSTLGGLLSLQAEIGVATPLLGQGVTVLYARLSL